MQHRSSIVKRFLRKDLWSEPHGPRSFTDTNWLVLCLYTFLLLVTDYFHPTMDLSIVAIFIPTMKKFIVGDDECDDNFSIVVPKRSAVESRPSIFTFWRYFLKILTILDSQQKLWFSSKIMILIIEKSWFIIKNCDSQFLITNHNFWISESQFFDDNHNFWKSESQFLIWEIVIHITI